MSTAEVSSAPVCAAEYVRMSTEQQKYSTANQSIAIRHYAAQRNITIVRTYADEGKSGLRLDGREALQQLLTDVQSGGAPFSTILVYDVSRWGRFQDADEPAHYEYLCKRAGISVQYCAEQFENDGSMIAALFKAIKRAMAAEYSRDLSVKVFAGQRRLIELGFRQGGPAGFGLRRMLIDERGEHKGALDRGQQKSIHTDRVILVPGPAEEIDAVREIYEEFIAGRSKREIAARLNARGLMTDLGRPWTGATVRQILINEKYIGNNIWNRRSFKLKGRRRKNSASQWIRANGAFKPIVSRLAFDQAQERLQADALPRTDDEMLTMLQRILASRGHLSARILDETAGAPSSSAYRHRFGGLVRAYQRIGIVVDAELRQRELLRSLRERLRQVAAAVVAGIARAGGSTAHDPATALLTINGELSLLITIARCRETQAGALRWRAPLRREPSPDLVLAARMDPANQDVLDYYVLPWVAITAGRLHLAEHNGVALDAYRHESLDPFFAATARAKFPEDL